MKDYPAQIVSSAARTPVGLTPASAAAAVRAGIGRVVEHPFYIDEWGDPLRWCPDPALDPNLERSPRVAALLTPPLLSQIETLPRSEAAVVLYLGAPESRPGWTEEDHDQLVRMLVRAVSAEGRALRVIDAGRGHAGALRALHDAREAIRRGVIDHALVAGVDSHVSPQTIAWLERHRQLATRRARSGFVPGEAAGVLTVCNEAFAKASRRPASARILGTSTASEVRRIKTDAEPLGEALATALRGAAATSPGPADDIYCDINGERYRSDEWGFAILRARGAFRDGTRYATATSSWGDLGAASGVLSCILAMEAWSRGYARGPIAAVWGSSESGDRAAVYLASPSAPHEPQRSR